MKRTGNMFNMVFSQENLYQAYLDARRGKRKKNGCFRFEISLGLNLAELYEEIHTGSYKPRPYFEFTVHEPKERIIHAPAFRDVVVQHAIYRIIYDVFDRTFINTSFACRKGYGTHKASEYTQEALRAYSSEAYTLKLDIRRFFYSINRDILRKQIEKKIKDKRLIEIMMLFAPLKDLSAGSAGEDGPSGIPIGNLLSQIYALIYLNPLDHYVKRELKVEHYVRYVDDFILIGLSGEKCRKYKELIVEFLGKELNLTLSRSTVQKIKRGVNFVGYRTWQDRRLIRKYSLYKFKKAVDKGKRESIMSLLGHAKQTESLGYMINILEEIAAPASPARNDGSRVSAAEVVDKCNDGGGVFAQMRTGSCNNGNRLSRRGLNPVYNFAESSADRRNDGRGFSTRTGTDFYDDKFLSLRAKQSRSSQG